MFSKEFKFFQKTLADVITSRTLSVNLLFIRVNIRDFLHDKELLCSH